MIITRGFADLIITRGFGAGLIIVIIEFVKSIGKRVIEIASRTNSNR